MLLPLPGLAFDFGARWRSASAEQAAEQEIAPQQCKKVLHHLLRIAAAEQAGLLCPEQKLAQRVAIGETA
jgi:hypothetical protein